MSNGKTESQKKLYRIPIALITSNPNSRNPLSADLQANGYSAWPEEGKVSLWELGTGDEQQRAEYVRLIEEFEQEEHGIYRLASLILVNGQQPVKVKENKENYILVEGARRTLAVLYNACKLAKPAIVEALFMKGNSAAVLYHSIAENSARKNPDPIERAKAIQMALNMNETIEEIAKHHGVGEQTINNWLKVLELEPNEQKALQEGKVKISNVLAEKRKKRESTRISNDAAKRRLRTKKEIMTRYSILDEEFPNRQNMSLADQREIEILEWILNLRDYPV